MNTGSFSSRLRAARLGIVEEIIKLFRRRVDLNQLGLGDSPFIKVPTIKGFVRPGLISAPLNIFGRSTASW